ncbi:interferon-induced protein 35 [Cololabis saira]|uniref:interferon-induced protein 35 n=1 Tax=Cololabis saira TaxID=129043 RepID=UPI002AD440A3|nr:interferon-induced protein 35 [Cololabis saira]
MSSEEDFSLVVEPLMSEDTLEGVVGLINKYKKDYERLQAEQKELVASRDESRDRTEEFRLRCETLSKSQSTDEDSQRQRLANEKGKLDVLKQEETVLREEIQKVQDAVREQEAQNAGLREKADVFSSMPQKKFVFRGATQDADDWQTLEMKPHVIYPMEGGTALITFEEEDVATKILDMKTHKVDLGGECSISVEARPVHLMLPSLVEIDSDVCHRRILVSDLPAMDTDTLLNKLEIHFSKSKHGGGEVDSCEFLADSGTAAIAFVGDGIAKRLAEVEYHEVKLQKKKHRVRVTAFLNGQITNLKTKMTTCPRTVLLTGIPNVMEEETMQDLLEINFQKNANGGGEIEAFLYNPLGQQASAVFGGASDRTEE